MDALNTAREREKENCVTTDAIVLSIIYVNQRLEDVTKAGSDDEHPTPGGILRSIAGVHQLFEDVVKTSKSMQEVFSDVADLAPKIRIQKVAFDNGCKLLFVTVAKSRQDVDNMIEDPGHPIWKDRVAHRNLDKVMARFYTLCSEALEHFQKSLNELNGGLQRRQGNRKGNKRYRTWLNRSKPLTVGTTKKFPELVHDLRNYNDIFCTLIWQVVPRRSGHMLGSSFAEDFGCPYATEAARESHRHFECIQRASQTLYNTLSQVWTCRDHEAHSLSISLNFDFAKPGTAAQSKDVGFNVAVTSPYFGGLYGLVVDSARSEYCTCQTVEENRSSKTTYQGDKVAGSAARTISSDSSEHDAETTAHRAGGQGADALMRPESMQNEVPDLVLKEEFFRCLRKPSATIESKGMIGCSCLEHLERNSGPELLFSYVLRCDYRKRGSHSLDDVLVRANSEHRAIPVGDRLRLASFLAAGVLHLNTSSWLPQAWSSKDIYFFDMNDYERCALGEPFLQAQLDGNITRGPVHGVTNSVATRSILLSLGLVLIELAFSAPWRKLQLREDITKSLLEWERDLLNLMRLSETVSRELGSRYAKVVQTCLFQGLGAQETHGHGKAELNEVIFKDIVRELDSCVSAVTLS